MNRRFSALLILLPLLAACEPVAAPGPEYRPEEAGTLDHALCLLGFTAVSLSETPTGHHLVKARINGRQGQFVLDTGANASVVDERHADHFGLPAGAPGLGGAVGVGGQVRTRQVRINDLQLGKIAIRQRRIAIADLGAIARALGGGPSGEVHGILGQDVLKEHRGVIDVAGERLHLIETDKDPSPIDSALCKTGGADG